jgi:hypothetical protein
MCAFRRLVEVMLIQSMIFSLLIPLYCGWLLFMGSCFGAIFVWSLFNVDACSCIIRFCSSCILCSELSLSCWTSSRSWKIASFSSAYSCSAILVFLSFSLLFLSSCWSWVFCAVSCFFCSAWCFCNFCFSLDLSIFDCVTVVRIICWSVYRLCCCCHMLWSKIGLKILDITMTWDEH